MSLIKLNKGKLVVNEPPVKPKRQPRRKGYTPEQKKLINDAIEATLLGFSDWMDSADCIVKNESGEQITASVEAADPQAQLMYAHINLQLQKKGIIIA
jgi:hypothetical protein